MVNYAKSLQSYVMSIENYNMLMWQELIVNFIL